MLRFKHTKAIASFVAVAALAVGASIATGAEPDTGAEVRFYNWEEYVDPQVLEDFEAEFGIKVIVETFTDENELVSVIQGDPSRYDLFSTSDATLFEMGQQRLLAELDHGNIPNLANIDPVYMDLPNDPGNKYGVPYDWGTTGIAYNRDCVQPEEESWGLLMDPTVAGRVAMDTDFTVVLGSILKYLGHPLNSTDPAQVEAAVAVLRDLRSEQGLEFIIWNEMLDQLVTGELCVGQTFNGDTAVYIDEYPQLGYFVPTEGSDCYIDVLAIPRDAPNKIGAELFINYVLRPEVHAANNDYTGYAVPNLASIEGGFVDGEALDDPVRYPSTKGLEPWKPFRPDVLSLWNRAWAEFMADSA